MLADNTTRTGHYDPSQKAIHMGTDALQWTGRPGLLFHEFGHHLHHVRNVISAVVIDPKIKQAVNATRKRLNALDKANPGSYAPHSAHKVACQAYGVANYSGATVTEKSKVSRYCDTIGGVTKGKFGWGHTKSYYAAANHGAMEAFAHTFSAIADGDAVFQTAFPELVDAVRAFLPPP